jgi:DNA polymerase-4
VLLARPPVTAPEQSSDSMTDPAAPSTKTNARWPRVVFHVDMDAFYAAIEQRDNPDLRGKPLIVGGTGNRGVVSTASYEARPFGVHSAMPTYRARQLCPQGIFVAPRHGYYTEVSRQLMAILGDYAPDVEPLSLDEAFLDMTGTEALFGPPEKTARRLQDEIRAKLALDASIGVATIKFIAKIGSDLNKPAGITVCPPGRERAFLAPLPVERLWGLGKKNAPRVRAMGYSTIGDVQSASRQRLEGELGQLGTHIWLLARAEDPRRVQESSRKSHGAERTLDQNIQGREVVRLRLLPLIDEVAAGLRKEGVKARGVRLKIKYADFQQTTRHQQLLEPANDAGSLQKAVEALLDRVDLDRPIRLVGMAAFDLQEGAAPAQQSLFAAPEGRPERQKLDEAIDAVTAKFGKGAVRRASADEVPRSRSSGKEGD